MHPCHALTLYFALVLAPLPFFQHTSGSTGVESVTALYCAAYLKVRTAVFGYVQALPA